MSWDSRLYLWADLIERQARCARDQHVEQFAEVDELFHRAIVTAARNAIATRCYAGLADRQRRMTIGAVGPRPDRLAGLVAEQAPRAARPGGRPGRGTADFCRWCCRWHRGSSDRLASPTLAALGTWLTYPLMLAALAAIAIACTATIASAWSRHLPAT